MDCSPPDSSGHGISQAGIVTWVAISFSSNLTNPGIETVSPVQSGRFFKTEPPGETHNEYYLNSITVRFQMMLQFINNFPKSFHFS